MLNEQVSVVDFALAKVPHPTKIQKTAWRSFLVSHLLSVIPPRGKAKFRTRCPGQAKRRDLQIKAPLGKWIEHPLSRQLFDELRSGAMCLRLADGKYSTKVTGESFTPSTVPQPFYPWEEYDGRLREEKKLPPINKSIVPYIRFAFRTQDTTPDTCTPNWMSKLHHWQRSLLQRVDIEDVDFAIQTLHRGAVAACDGGANIQKGSFGFCISGMDGTVAIRGRGSTDGETPSSFRAEAFGLAAVLSCWSGLRHHANGALDNTELQICCDNNSLVVVCNRILQMKLPKVDRNGNENDIIACIIDAALAFKDLITLTWIRSHQDESGIELSIEAQLNVEADRLATVALGESTETPDGATSRPGENFSYDQGHKHYQLLSQTDHSRPLQDGADATHNQPSTMAGGHVRPGLVDFAEQGDHIVWHASTSDYH